ncbi:MAG: TAXI family TRAP transporter solute-binding subunit [Xanthobacteraceae bacterium]|nr:TAXI family TRAP transporter solute-binding subunit [Xanthobacteraceae bacterium]
MTMKLWLAWNFGRGKKTDAAAAHTSARPMSMESLEHIVRSRVRMFLRHTWLVTVLGSIVLGGGVWAAFYLMTAPTVMRIAAGPSGSANVELVHVLTQKLADDRDKVRLQLVGTGGPKESAQALRDAKADLAILPSTVGNAADWPVIAVMRQNVMALIVPAPAATSAKKEASAPEKKEASVPEKKEKPGKEAKAAKGAAAAKTVKHGKSAHSTKTAKNTKSDKTAKATKSEDADADDGSSDDTDNADAGAMNKLDKVTKLVGHRVGIVTGSVATRDLLNIVLNHYGVAADQVQVSLIDPKNLAEAVRNDQIDAIFVAGSATGQAISDAVAAASRNGQAPSFIPIDQAEGIAKRIPAFDSADIDAGTFGGNPPMPDDTLTTLSFPEYLVARKSFSHEAVGTLAKLIYSSRLALAAGMPGEIKIEAPSTDKDAAALVHSGALAYLNDDQKSFFDKYGDDIFYGLLIFPIFGSAIAGVASYFHNNGRTRRLRLLQRLLDLVRKAHTAPSLEVLDQMQIDVDHLVIAIIHQTEHEEYDQAVQMSFSLALDQVRFAIAARRAILVENGAGSKAGTKAAAA